MTGASAADRHHLIPQLSPLVSAADPGGEEDGPSLDQVLVEKLDQPSKTTIDALLLRPSGRYREILFLSPTSKFFI